MVVLVTSLIAKVIITICYSLAQAFSPKEAKDDSCNNIIVNNEAKEVQFKDGKDVEQNTSEETEVAEVQDLPEVERKLVEEVVDRETKL